MTEQPSFEVVFRGDIRLGETLGAVRERLSGLFRLDPARLDQFFSGRPVLLRRDLTRGEAERFGAVLEEAGVLTEMRPAVIAARRPSIQEPSAGIEPSADNKPSADKKPSANEAPSANHEPGLAPPGADLLRPEERPRIVTPLLSLDHLSLAAPGSEVLRPEERQRSVPRCVDVSHLSLSP